MRFLSKSKLQTSTRGAAFVEYVIILGLVGVMSIFTVLGFGAEIRDTFNEPVEVLASNGIPSQSSIEVQPPAAPIVPSPPSAPTLASISASPYAPDVSGRDPTRFYEEFVIVRVENGGNPYNHSVGFADDYNPAAIVAINPTFAGSGSSFISDYPFSDVSEAAAMCIFASQNLGTILDPNETFFPGISPSLTDPTQIQMGELVLLERNGGETGLDETPGFTTLTGFGIANDINWSGPSDSREVIYAFTCSRPL